MRLTQVAVRKALPVFFVWRRTALNRAAATMNQALASRDPVPGRFRSRLQNRSCRKIAIFQPMIRRTALPLLILVTLLACPAGQADSSDEWQIERNESRIELAPDIRMLIIDNRRGDIRLRRGDAGFLDLRAVHQHPGSPDSFPVWATTRRGRSLVLTAEPKNSDDPRARVDLVIRVPPDLALRLHSDHGDIETRRHDAPILARTDLGDLAIQSTASVDLLSRQGSIQAGLFGAPPKSGSRLRAPKGTIDLVVEAASSWRWNLRGCPMIQPATPNSRTDETSGTTCTRIRQGDRTAPLLRASAGGAVSLTELQQANRS